MPAFYNDYNYTGYSAAAFNLSPPSILPKKYPSPLDKLVLSEEMYNIRKCLIILYK